MALAAAIELSLKLILPGNGLNPPMPGARHVCTERCL